MEKMNKPQMPILRETPDQVYQRMANRAKALYEARGETPPATAEGEFFYDLWYPFAEEISENQQLLEYAFLQGFLVRAEGEYLDAHGNRDGLTRKEGEDDETYRERILKRTRTEEGNGRRADYEVWARMVPGVGNAVAIEKERNDLSIDLYLTDPDGQPVSEEVAEEVRKVLWISRRIVGHDLACHPAPVYPLKVAVKLTFSDAGKRDSAIQLIAKRIRDYIKGRSLIVYQQIGALFFVDGVTDFHEYVLNGGTDNVNVPEKVVATLDLEVSP
ncbi:baseplate J/gp47 family protein [Brevibacillus dissolubilis]|uniref:baseplate J/gp47 family protein n=1 Tax=Brevibacillus dissolubilis TaxID=1844116 RepID=UPI00111706B6|nr:baseplate J/gp47 family protein [Brevibacillus dissolubilis]